MGGNRGQNCLTGNTQLVVDVLFAWAAGASAASGQVRLFGAIRHAVVAAVSDDVQ
jgi:hypothetical protein